jgi:hypothetical protein
MAYYILRFSEFDKKNSYNKYFITLNGDTYIFTVRWNSYAKTAYLTITDFEDTPILSGRALVNGLKIRNHKLPYVLYFMQKNAKTYEPTLNTLSTDFILIYNDEELIQ